MYGAEGKGGLTRLGEDPQWLRIVRTERGTGMTFEVLVKLADGTETVVGSFSAPESTTVQDLASVRIRQTDADSPDDQLEVDFVQS